MHRREFGGAIGATVAGWFSGASCGGGRNTGPATLVVAATPYITMSPLHLALERKYFERVGLTIQLERISSANASNAALAGGKLDVAFIPLTAAVVNAVLKGARLRVAAGREYLSPDCGALGGMLVRKKSFPDGLNTGNLAQLRGKKISAAGSNTGVIRFFFDKVLERGGLTDQDVQMIPLDGAEEPLALSRGLVDAASNPATLEQLPPDIAKQLDHVNLAAGILPGFQASFVVFGQRLVDGDVSIGGRFLAAYQKAVREYTKGGEPEFFRDYARKTKLDLEALRRACRSNVSLDGKLDLNSIQIFLDWAVRRGYAERALKAEEIADPRFVEEAGKYSI